ncbi:HEAT repeat-containing protein [Besnoitia besnoiti]|uniref:HEAT repeat-containing protein n=1 Tax=Besnoitia besnoiti TaxID=94643 RepID=A0A2A9M7H4_BESBE|nr:HEAT repeat-containing protein [Besnoitia besnoiti]PFH33134.1 HEAT repeat-containing protein [Besnoitia besnoiti]
MAVSNSAPLPLLPALATPALDEKWFGECSFLLFSRAPYNPTASTEQVFSISPASLQQSTSSRLSAAPSSQDGARGPPDRLSLASPSPSAASAVSARLSPQLAEDEKRFGALPPPSSDRILGAAKKAAILWGEREEEALEADAKPEKGTDRAKKIFNKFFSEDHEERLIAAASIGFLCSALGDGRRDFISFLLSFIETEDDSLVLETVARELHALLAEALPNPEAIVASARADPESCEVSLFFSLLHALLLTADDAVKEAAVAASFHLFSAARLLAPASAELPAVESLAEDAAVLFRAIFLPRLLQMLQGGLSAQRVAALLLPAALYHLRLVAELLPRSDPRDAGSSEAGPDLRPFERELDRLVSEYVMLCGEGADAAAAPTLQREAGSQLPLFVTFCARVVGGERRKARACASAERAASLGKTRLVEKKTRGAEEPEKKGCEQDGGKEERATTSEDEAEPQIVQALYEATYFFLRASADAPKLQGIKALATMAEMDAAAFRSIGDSLLPVLCADPSWRVRAAVCEALDKLGRFLVATAAEDGKSTDAEAVFIPPAALGQGTCLVSVLAQFLKDRDLNVKAAALRTTRKLVKMTNNCTGIMQTFLEEGESLFNAAGVTQSAPILVECMDTLCAMAGAATSEEASWQLTVFAFPLLRVDDWHVAMSFLDNLAVFVSAPPPSFLSVLLTRLDMLVNLPSSRWRIRARILQKIPLLLLAPKIEEETATQFWLLLVQLLQDDVWAVRQEGPAAIEQLVLNARAEEEHHEAAAERQRAKKSAKRQEALGDDSTMGSGENAEKIAAEEARLAIRFAREGLLGHLLPIFEQLRDDKRYFVRGELCRYILVSPRLAAAAAAFLHLRTGAEGMGSPKASCATGSPPAIKDLYSREIWISQFAPLLEQVVGDRVAQTRYAAAQAVKILLEEAANETSVVPSDWLQKMKAKLIRDSDPDVAEVLFEDD